LPAYEKLSDPILVKRAKDGDQRALEALCARHQPRVEKLARRLLRDPEDARDATQEALAKMCVRIKQFRGDAQFATWLHRLAVNTCHDVASRRKDWQPLPDDLREAPGPERDLGTRDELRTCLLELPPDQARVVVLKDALGYSFEEIARASGMPVGTAKCYAHRGRNRLRARLGGEAAA
jgi:RNA polymerase sigma-70 factor (ECF subfamily)